MSTRRALRLKIEGRVQGVGFRQFVARAAAARALDGWVRNRRDGRVEAVVSGPAADVDAFLTQCRSGPPASHVARLDVEPTEEAPERGFIVRPTI